MLSSTCNDLRDIREQLRSFLASEHEYEVLLSENPQFPVDHHSSIIETCQSRASDSDILILVLDKRYGYVPENSGVSITHLEYTAAKNSGIPVLAYINSDLLPLLNVWERNPGGDFSASIDNPLLLSFVKELRGGGQQWCFWWSTGKDIIESLRPQLAWLTCQGLRALRRLKGGCAADRLPAMSRETAQILCMRGDSWRARLFAMYLKDVISDLDDDVRNFRYGLVLGDVESLDAMSAIHRARTSLLQLRQTIGSCVSLVTEHANRIINADDEDLSEIDWFCRQYVAVLREMIDYSQRMRRIVCDSQVAPLIESYSTAHATNIDRMLAFPQEILDSLDTALARDNPSGETIQIPLSISFTLDFKDIPGDED
jgi:hypothetical protein